MILFFQTFFIAASATTEYMITVSITDGRYDGTTGSQFVKIKGTEGETGELECVADFNVIGQDVECKVKSSKNIGEFECIDWRTTTNDGWDFDQVSHLISHNWYTTETLNRHQRTNFSSHSMVEIIEWLL
jgi:hypothetical protein